jgi:predicted RNase H-like HicB family nuclease
MKYPVIIHKSKYGYDVECPILPGCCSQGDTFEEALENIKDAIKTYLETVEELNKRKLNKNKKLEYVKVRI